MDKTTLKAEANGKPVVDHNERKALAKVIACNDQKQESRSNWRAGITGNAR